MGDILAFLLSLVLIWFCIKWIFGIQSGGTGSLLGNVTSTVFRFFKDLVLGLLTGFVKGILFVFQIVFKNMFDLIKSALRKIGNRNSSIF